MKNLFAALIIVLTFASTSSAEFDQGFDALCDYFEELPIETPIGVIADELQIPPPDDIFPRWTLFNFTKYIWYNVGGMSLSVALMPVPPQKRNSQDNPLKSMARNELLKKIGGNKDTLLFTGYYAVTANNTECIYWHQTNAQPIKRRGLINDE